MSDAKSKRVSGCPGLRRRADGSFRLVFKYRCPVDGTQKQVTRVWRDRPLDFVKLEARRMVRDVESGETARRDADAEEREARLTIREAAKEIVAAREGEGGAPATIHEFSSALVGTKRTGEGPILRYLGSLGFGELTPLVLRDFVTKLREEKLGPRRIRNIMKCLSIAVRIARIAGLAGDLRANPVREAKELGLKLPAHVREEPIFISVSDATKLATRAEIDPLRKLRWLFGFLGGLRTGEAAALTWSDVDLERGEIRVTKAHANVGGTRAPKTLAGRRVVPLHADLAALVRSLRPENHSPGGLIFVGRRGKAHRPNVARWLRDDLSLVTGQEIDPKVTAHATRRSFCSWLEAARVPHEVIERLVGHEQRSVLGRHYAAGDFDVLRDAIGKLPSLRAPRLVRVA